MLAVEILNGGRKALARPVLVFVGKVAVYLFNDDFVGALVPKRQPSLFQAAFGQRSNDVLGRQLCKPVLPGVFLHFPDLTVARYNDTHEQVGEQQRGEQDVRNEIDGCAGPAFGVEPCAHHRVPGLAHEQL